MKFIGFVIVKFLLRVSTAMGYVQIYPSVRLSRTEYKLRSKR